MAVEDNNRASELPLPQEMVDSVVNRLHRLEGQARGVKRMVEEGRDCREILNQIAAIKAAAHSLGTVVLEHYVTTCLHDPLAFSSLEEARSAVRQVIRQMAR